jgi:dipeptidyl aminopeptidase/acylaminoacyl peptidase
MREYDDDRDYREDSGSSSKKVWIVLAIVGGGLFLVLLVCAGLGVVVYRGMQQVAANIQQQVAQLSPALDLQAEDYAQARSKFKTKLLRQGPAPQPWNPVQVPAGAKEIEFQSGNLRLKAWVNPPPDAGKRKLPAVLFLHGGWAFGEDDWEMTQPFRGAGYVVMTPILRGENGQPGAFSMFYDEVDDVLAAADHLAKLPYVDDKHIYVSGHSAGGTLTLLAAMASKRFRAAASFSGSPNQAGFVQGRPQEVPFDSSNMQELLMRSPTAYATSFKCPVRIYYGDQEFAFAPESELTAIRAKGQGLDVEAHSVPGDHMSAVPEAMRQAIQFFKQKK